MTRVQTLTAIVAAMALSGAACSKKDKEGEKKTEPAAKTAAATDKATPADKAEDKATDTPAGKTEDAPSTSNIKVDDEVMTEIKTIASTCKVELERGYYRCENKEDAKLKDELYGYGDQAKSKVETIGTIAVALADSDPKIQTVAATLANSKFAMGWGPGVEVGQVDKEIADSLRATWAKLPEKLQSAASTTTVYANSLADMDKEMHAAIEGMDNANARRRAWEASMFYGRMKAFEKIKGIGASDDPKEKLLAVTAANNMPKITDAERPELCSWAHGFLGADAEDVKESDIFEQAGWILSECGNEWVDKLLDFGEEQAKKNKFDRKYYFVYRELCHAFAPGMENQRVNQAQCDRNYKFLEGVAKNKKVEGPNRAFALDAIAYSRRDAKSLKLMQKFKKDKDPKVKEYAERNIKMLEGYVKK